MLMSQIYFPRTGQHREEHGRDSKKVFEQKRKITGGQLWIGGRCSKHGRCIIQRNMRMWNVNARYVRAQCQQFLNAREK